MNLEIDRKQLVELLGMAFRACPTRSPKPILLNVLLTRKGSELSCFGTDLECGVLATKELEQHGDGFRLVVPPKAFEFLRISNSATAEIQCDAKSATFYCSRAKLAFATENADEFPACAETPKGSTYTMPSMVLVNALRRTIFAIDEESSRYALAAIRLDMGNESHAISCDGRRLAAVPLPATGDIKAALVPPKPAKLAMAMLHAGDCELIVTDNDVWIRSAGVHIYGRQVEGRYPRWRDIFPKGFRPSVSVDSAAFLSVIQQAAVATDNTKSRGVMFHFGGGELRLESSAEGRKSEASMPIDGDCQCTVKLDPLYVRQFLDTCDGPVVVRFKDSESAVTFEEGGAQYVVMSILQEK